jgi:hypothetical protein
VIAIYVAQDSESRKKYVGQTGQRLRTRITSHHHRLKNPVIVAITDDPEEADFVETFWIMSLGTLRPRGLNHITIGNTANSSRAGVKKSRVRKLRKTWGTHIALPAPHRQA